MITVVFDKLLETQLSYAAVYFCISMGFLALRAISHRQAGSGYWTLSFLFNSLGFLFWSGSLPLKPGLSFLLGEVFHITGFILLTLGAFRFAGRPLKTLHWVFLAVWFTAWVGGIAWYPVDNGAGAIVVKVLRALLFLPAGLVLIFGDREKALGVSIAGTGLILWGVYIVVFTFIQINPYVYYGLLVGFHLLAAFGMVAMVMDRIRIRAEKSEKHVAELEGLLPICSYCKNIRDENNQWHRLEVYIEERSQAEFSHGICPDCFSKYRPDK